MPDDGVMILTGAASGIGRASAEALAAKAYPLALVDVNKDALARVVEECRKRSPRTIGYSCDVTDGSAVTRTSEQIHKEFGKVAVLVNCAGIGWHAPFLDIEPEGWMRIFNVNVMGTVHFTRAALPGMIAAGGGTIINVGSRRGIEPKAKTTAYAASKPALLGMSKALALGVSDYGVKVTYLAPGGTKTELATPKDARFLEPSIIANAVVFIVENGGNTWVRDLVILPLGL